MTEVEDLKAYYENLLIKQYHDQPNAIATIGAVSEAMLADMVYTQVRDCFDWTTAEGVQLDTIAKYIGTSRYPDSSTELTDGDLRFMIGLKIIQNSCDQSLKSIQDFLYKFYPGRIMMVDNKDMTLTYEFSVFDKTLMTFAKETDILPRPMGVGLILSAIYNPNGDFGYSWNGIIDTPPPVINGLGWNFISYVGGTMLFTA